jgi:hypothetical protein
MYLERLWVITVWMWVAGTKKCTKTAFLYRALTMFCVNQINCAVYWRMKDEMKTKTEVLSITEWILLHWWDKVVRTWDEHAASAALSSPMGHIIRMLSLLLCFSPIEHRMMTSSLLQCFSPIEHKMIILSLCSVISSRIQDEDAVLASLSSSVSKRVHRFQIL